MYLDFGGSLNKKTQFWLIHGTILVPANRNHDPAMTAATQQGTEIN